MCIYIQGFMEVKMIQACFTVTAIFFFNLTSEFLGISEDRICGPINIWNTNKKRNQAQQTISNVIIWESTQHSVVILLQYRPVLLTSFFISLLNHSLVLLLNVTTIVSVSRDGWQLWQAPSITKEMETGTSEGWLRSSNVWSLEMPDSLILVLTGKQNRVTSSLIPLN